VFIAFLENYLKELWKEKKEDYEDFCSQYEELRET